MPCGQKNRTREMIQSQTVTPPLAAMEGTTLRLKTATTKRRTRSQRPNTRRRRGDSSTAAVGGAVVTSFVKFVRSMVSRREDADGCENYKAAILRLRS